MVANKLYRKEDILQMEREGINDGFGLGVDKGGQGGDAPYSIWLWKGGGKISENIRTALVSTNGKEKFI